MNKEDFRLDNKHLAELRNELRSQPALKTRHLFLPVTAAFAVMMWFMLLPSAKFEQEQRVRSINSDTITYQELFLLEKKFESTFEEKKKVKKTINKFQRWKKNKPDILADRMASTRQRLQKLKAKINS